MQQSSVSQSVQPVNQQTVASRMLHSLMNDYEGNSPRQSEMEVQREGQYQRERLSMVRDIGRSQLMVDGNIKDSNVQNHEEDVNGSNVQNHEEDVNESNIQNQEEQLQQPQESYRSNVSVRTQSEMMELMSKKQSQLKQLENFLLKEFEEINENKEKYSRLKERISEVGRWVKQLRMEYGGYEKVVVSEIDQMRGEISEGCRELAVRLIEEHRESTEAYIREIVQLRDELQRKDDQIGQSRDLLQEKDRQIAALGQLLRQREGMVVQYQQEMETMRREVEKAMMEREVAVERLVEMEAVRNQQQINRLEGHNHRQVNQETSLPTVVMDPAQHLEMSFSADNNKEKVLINTILNQNSRGNLQVQTDRQKTSLADEKERRRLLSMSSLGVMEQRNSISERQLTAGFEMRFEVDASSVENKQSEQDDFKKDQEPQRSLQHSQSQQSPRQQSIIQTSQVQRMNTMSFSLNQGMDDVSDINQLDVFSENNFESNQQKSPNENMSEYGNGLEENEDERRHIRRSAQVKRTPKEAENIDDKGSKPGVLYCFKKGNVNNNKVNECAEGQLLNQSNNTQMRGKYTLMNEQGKPEKQQLILTQKQSQNKPSSSIKPVIVPKLAKPSPVINLQPVPQQPSTKRKRSPHRYDYCRLYEQQEIREIENLNEMCNNILLKGSQRVEAKGDDDLGRSAEGYVVRESRDVKDISPSRKVKQELMNGAGYGGDALLEFKHSLHSLDTYSAFTKPLVQQSHSKKNLTIQIPQSPNPHHGYNPYYKPQNHVHQISVQQFSPQREKSSVNLTKSYSNLSRQPARDMMAYEMTMHEDVYVRYHQNDDTFVGRYQQPVAKQPYALAHGQSELSIVDRKEYIRSKIQHIKRKNIINRESHLIGNSHLDGLERVNLANRQKSPRVISFLKSEEQENTASRVELERPSVVNRSLMNNRSAVKRQPSTDINVKPSNNRLKQTQQKVVKGYDFSEDKFQKEVLQKNRYDDYRRDKTSMSQKSISIQNSGIKGREMTSSVRKSQQSVHGMTNEFMVNEGEENDIYQQLNRGDVGQENYVNVREGSEEQSFVRSHQQQGDRKSPLKRSTSPYVPSSSPLKPSMRTNNTMYLQPELRLSGKKHSASEYHYQEEKYSEENLYRHPYLKQKRGYRKEDGEGRWYENQNQVGWRRF